MSPIRKQKTKTATYVFLAVMMMLLLGGALYFAMKTNTPAATQKGNTAVNSNSIGGGTTDGGDIAWQDFSNAGLGYSLKYPIGWKSDTTTSTFTSEDYIETTNGAKVKVTVTSLEGKDWQDVARENLLTDGQLERVGSRQVLRQTSTTGDQTQGNAASLYLDMIAFPSDDEKQVVILGLQTVQTAEETIRPVFLEMVTTFAFLGASTANENANQNESTAAQTYNNTSYRYRVQYPADWKYFKVSDARVGFLPSTRTATAEYLGDITLTYVPNGGVTNIKDYYNGTKGVDLYSDAQGGTEDLTVGGKTAIKFKNIVGMQTSTAVVATLSGGFLEIWDEGNTHQKDGVFADFLGSISFE